MQENEPPVKIHINPPPQDKRCERCGRHISELKPFGGAGDPLVGDFSGALLIKTFRSMADFTEKEHEKDPELKKNLEEMRVLDGRFGEIMYKGGISTGIEYEQVREIMVKEIGEEKMNQLDGFMELNGTVSASWECRDCVIK